MKYTCQTWAINYLPTTYFISFHCFIPNQYQVWSWNGCLYQKKVGTLGQKIKDDHENIFRNKNKPMQTGTILIFIIHAKNSCFHWLPPFLPWNKNNFFPRSVYALVASNSGSSDWWIAGVISEASNNMGIIGYLTRGMKHHQPKLHVLLV